MKLKSLVCLALVGLFIFLSLSPINAMKLDTINNQRNWEPISKHNYIQAKANALDISLVEASILVDQENNMLVLQYCMDHNIDPNEVRDVYGINSITYTDYYTKNIGGELVYFWYVDVYQIMNCYIKGDRVGAVKYGAWGRVVQDAHSKTFAQSPWLAYSNEYGSGIHCWDETLVEVNWEGYTSVFVRVEGNSELTSSHAFNLGISAVLDAGYTLGYDYVYRKTITKSFHQTP